MSNYLLNRTGDWIFYNSIHSYSQLVLLPWGYTNDLPDDYQQLKALADKGADALFAVHGKTYEVLSNFCVISVLIFYNPGWLHSLHVVHC